MIQSQNTVLRAIELPVRTRFIHRVEVLRLPKGQVLQETGEPVDWVYFPEDGVAGLSAETSAGESALCAVVGRHGAVGSFEACGSRKAFYRAVVQVPGEFSRMRAGTYRELFDQSPALRTAVHKVVEVLLAEARQYVACNALHSLQSRLARVLLEIYEKGACGEALPLTQEALAQMLGVQRTSASLALAALEQAGGLRRGRGVLLLCDAAALENEACSCRSTLALAKEDVWSENQSVCEA